MTEGMILDTQPNEWPIDEIERRLLEARADAIKNTIRLRDLQYCRQAGVIVDADIELNEKAVKAPESVELYHLLRELFRRKKATGEGG